MEALPGQLWNRVLEVWDVLAFSFDFEPFERALGPEAYATPAPWFPAFVVPDATVAVVGRDGSGGAYVCCERGNEQCCLHINPRGHAVSLGEDVQQALALLVALPYWPELLQQCPSGELACLRARARVLEAQACEDLHELPAARQELQAFLELPELSDPVGHLHAVAVARPLPLTVWSPHGWCYESPVRALPSSTHAAPSAPL